MQLPMRFCYPSLEQNTPPNYLLKVKGAMPQLGRRWGAQLPLAAVEPVGG